MSSAICPRMALSLTAVSISSVPLTTDVTSERSRAFAMATSLAQRLGTVPLKVTTDAWTDTLMLLNASSESCRSI